ncbi:MAG: spore germination protein GerA family [Eubacterium sp.]|jgi:spore germination protein KA|nr:spore germination protein GerA family [Eubacterium sp.]
MYKGSRKIKLENNIDSKETASKIPEYLLSSLDDNISLLKQIFSNDGTLIIRELKNKTSKDFRGCLLYIEGMVNTEIVNEYIIQPILACNLSDDLVHDNLIEELMSKVIVSNNVSLETEVNKVVSAIISGDTVFLSALYDKALVINSKGWQTRTISEPESARVVRGPREGFTEAIMMNLTLVRRKIKNSDLKFKFREIGERTHTRVCICFIESLAMEGILDELEQRLDKINIDGIMDSGYIQELIKDSPYSPFETVGFSERPDVVASKLLEGRVALFVDGSPFVLTVPYLFVENFQANEDYYNNFIFASINRLIRGFTAVVSNTIPAIFLALVTYHQEMLPTPLLLSISASRQGVPLPTSLSLFVMLFIFDILREVGTRMPSPIGQAVNIVGTLVLGQAAVEARLVSAPVVIITALTGIMTLINMNFIGSTITFRTYLLLGASVLGFYGFFLSLIMMYLHLMSIRSFGVPYMMNVTRAMNHDGQDAWIRAPWWVMTLRPKILGNKNLTRQPRGSKKGKQPT